MEMTRTHKLMDSGLDAVVGGTTWIVKRTDDYVEFFNTEYGSSESQLKRLRSFFLNTAQGKEEYDSFMKEHKDDIFKTPDGKDYNI